VAPLKKNNEHGKERERVEYKRTKERGKRRVKEKDT
jgi:hypothetical protein